MSPVQQDAEDQNMSRPRANTTSFASLWRRPRPEHPHPPVPVQVIPQSLTLDELIAALTPPAVPSLVYAKNLASLLSTHSPIPRNTTLNPILATLCASDSPISLQCAGFDILSAYWEHNEAGSPSIADRQTYLSLFLGPGSSWAVDLWEPRFKALRALTKFGSEIVGVETELLNIIKSWIKGCFDGLPTTDGPIERAERAERERSVDILSAFLTSVVEIPEVVARISEDELMGVLQFYAGLVEQAIHSTPETPDPLAFSSTPTESNSNSSTPSRSRSHRRHPSSISSIPSPIVSTHSQTPIYHPKRPIDIAVMLYLNHLSSQLKILSHDSLDTILPLLFGALTSCASPLPRLSVMPHSPRKSPSEDRLTETLNSLFAGPYSASCMRILKRYLGPPSLPDSNLDPTQNILAHIRLCFGAHRTLRNYIRRALFTRLARAYISREASVGSSHSGAPGHMDVERELMERAWPKDDSGSGGLGDGGWDAGRLGRALSKGVRDWVNFGMALDDERIREGREKILDEVAGILKDVLQELDSREDNMVLEEDEATAVGEILYNLAGYIHLLVHPDGSPVIIPISQPTAAWTPFLRTLCSLFSRDHATKLNPLLSSTLLYISDHLTDSDTARLPLVMAEQYDLSPTSPDWLSNWESLLRNPTLVNGQRPKTTRAAMLALASVYDIVKEMKTYRRPLADLVCEFCEKTVTSTNAGGDGGEDGGGEDMDAMWRVFGDEVVLRTTECLDDAEDDTVNRYIDLLVAVASEGEDEEDYDTDTASIITTDTRSTSPQATVMPVSTRTQGEFHALGRDRDKELAIPLVMSLFSSLSTGNPSRSQSVQPQSPDDQLDSSISPARFENTSLPRVIGAVSALISIFSQLAFTPFALEEKHLNLAVHVYGILVNLVTEGKSVKARLTALQFLMRLRADRDHRVYFVHSNYDSDGHIMMLASLIDRVRDSSVQQGERRTEEPFGDSEGVVRRARPRMPQERDGRRTSRGRGGVLSNSAPSRSRSRVATQSTPVTPAFKARDPIWHIPQHLPFVVAEIDTPSEALISYDPNGPDARVVLHVSSLLSAVIAILEKERNWEILSFVLCHLPVQLANKHLFCGPRSRDLVAKILAVLCTGILNEELASHIDYWPKGLKARDARGLAYHTLSVLVSYRRCFDSQQRHLLVEVFQTGLNEQLSTIKCCLHALSLSAFELQSSMTKCLSRILEKLSQIMSNPDMAVHILGFLSIVGSLPPLHANFTESDFKMVFGVALQYLQHHNRISESPTVSWALCQHVRILSYYLVYVWFLAVRLPDRPRHIRYITRQLLLANEGNDEVDEPTEVCFDWLARYTYASADPRPANSLLNDIVMNPSVHDSSPEISTNEKTWILGNAVVTIRTLTRLGWIEVVTRRPSGFTKFLCRVENAPMIGPGDVDPDIISGPASLMMERDLPAVQVANPTDDTAVPGVPRTLQDNVHDIFIHDKSSELPPPDPITGYVWSGSAPSQRRKAVAIDPAFFALQLSSYPDRRSPPNHRMIVEPSLLPKFFASLDRMPVIDTHKVGIMYVAPGQTDQLDILRNTHGSPAYTRFLEGIGRLIYLRGNLDVYGGGLVPDEDGEYAYAWWDDIGQILYHTATMMPSDANDPQCNNKKRHIGNDYIRVVWNDSGMPYRFDTLTTQFQFVNIVIEPHSLGATAAFSNNLHENEYFKVTVQRAPGMTEFAPIGHFKLISAENLPLLVRQLSLLADWFASVFALTQNDTVRNEVKTNWHSRLQAIRRLRSQLHAPEVPDPVEGVMGQEAFRDFTTIF